MESFFFVLKKLASRALFPVGLVLSLGGLGVLVWLAKPKSRLGPGLVIMAGLLLWGLSTPWLAGGLLSPLERMAGVYTQQSAISYADAEIIVVLAGSQRDAGFTPADRCGSSTTLRVLEGVRLWKQMPGSVLLLTGGTFFQQAPAAQAMADLAAQLGVPRQAIRLETTSWDTSDQARILAPALAGAPFVLVTSASHMPRALLIFRAQGLSPLPAPCDFHTATNARTNLLDFLPQAGGLALSERAIYEYLGLLYFEAKSLLSPVKDAEEGTKASAPAREK
jgi:uncharacterized SAM-binding protein YcdF (DUF218 family)